MNKNSLKVLRNLFLLVILIVVVRLIVLMLRIYLKKGENFRNKEGLYISPDSKIHGKGLFTDRSIEKEEFIFKAINNRNSERFYKIINEIPTVLMIIIILLVVLKPNIG